MTKAIGGVLAILALATMLLLEGQHTADAQGKGKGKGGTAVFELYKDKAGKFRFRFKDLEGHIVAVASSGHETNADCRKAIMAIQKEAAKAKIEDDTK